MVNGASFEAHIMHDACTEHMRGVRAEAKG